MVGQVEHVLEAERARKPRRSAVAVSALICTRDRPGQIGGAVTSILANAFPDFELMVIDQSSNEMTARALDPFLKDHRLRYIHAGMPGKGIALNIGLREARADIIVITDDDCEVPDDWLEKMAGLLVKYPKAGAAFCNVRPGPHDPSEGVIPHYLRSGEKVLRVLRDAGTHRGMGAGMAVRRSVMLHIGGFDEKLGPGSLFPAGEDYDIGLRALLLGFEVVETDCAEVLHHGFRTMAEAHDLARSGCFSLGAEQAKMLKCRQWAAFRFLLRDWPLHVFRPLLRQIFYSRRPIGHGRAACMARGFFAGLRMPVDRRSMRFR